MVYEVLTLYFGGFPAEGYDSSGHHLFLRVAKVEVDIYGGVGTTDRQPSKVIEVEFVRFKQSDVLVSNSSAHHSSKLISEGFDLFVRSGFR